MTSSLALKRDDIRLWLRTALADTASKDVQLVACALAVLAERSGGTSVEATPRQILRQARRIRRYGIERFLTDSRVY